MSGNVGVLALPFVIDNTAPTVGTATTAARSSATTDAADAVAIRDAGVGDGYAIVTRMQTDGVFPRVSRVPLVFVGGVATVDLQGSGTFHVQAYDAAGNRSRSATVRLPPS